MARVRSHRLFVLIALVGLALTFSGWASMAAETKKKEDLENRPERSIQMSAEFPGVQVPPGQTVTMNLIFDNKGRTNENVDVSIASIPKGWTARLKTDQYTVTGVSDSKAGRLHIRCPGQDDRRAVQDGSAHPRQGQGTPGRTRCQGSAADNVLSCAARSFGCKL